VRNVERRSLINSPQISLLKKRHSKKKKKKKKRKEKKIPLIQKA